MKSYNEFKAEIEVTKQSMAEEKYYVNKVVAIHMQMYAEFISKALLYETAIK